MYERVNINCAEVNSTRVNGSGIYFFNFHTEISDSQLLNFIINNSKIDIDEVWNGIVDMENKKIL